MDKGRKRKNKKAKESKDQGRKEMIKRLQQDYLQVLSCMYDFLASFGMHGTCMCVFSFLDITSMGFLGVTVVTTLPYDFQIAMV